MTLRWPRTLIGRILLGEAAAMTIVAIVLPVLLESVLTRSASLSQRRALLDQAQAVSAAWHPDAPPCCRLALSPFVAARYADAYDGRAFLLVGADGAVLAASRHSAAVPWRALPRGARPTFRHTASFSLASLPSGEGAACFWVLVAQNEAQPGVILDDVQRAFLGQYLLVLIPVLLLLFLVNGLLVRRLVTVVERVSAQAAAIGTRSLDARLGAAGLPAEIRPLADAVNRLLARLEAGFRRQDEFVANVAHELRTPLSTLLIRLDAVEDAAVRAAAKEQVVRVSHVVAQLRHLAAIELVGHDTAAAVDLGAVAEAVVAERAPAAFAGGHDIALTGTGTGAPVIVAGTAVLIEMALANLIDNALRHTPAGTAVSVRLDPDVPALVVEDDGPGIAAAAPGEATRRFWRADQSRSDGAGLGLSIIGRIMEVHGGTLDVDAPATGARLVLRFPARRLAP